MENSSLPTSAYPRPIPPALGYSGAAFALWIFRRPILALAGAAIHLTFALVKPVLLVLGALKLADLLQASRDSTPKSSSDGSGDGEALLVPDRPFSPTSQAPSAGLEI